ncbi:MAG: hypothetical protein OXF79_18605 [Chloroflexi bacterium]|nr:hypothetical protein [Chloroflexota bacterium]
MDEFKTTAKITKGGVLTLHNLPFAEGVEVDVTVTGIDIGTDLSELPPHPNRGTVLRYDRPFDPVITDEELDLVLESWDRLEREQQARGSTVKNQEQQ